MHAYAAIDLGTTRLKLAGFAPGRAPFAAIAEVASEVHHGGDGAARCRWSAIAAGCDELLIALGRWCGSVGATSLDLGLSGHVSSLLCWDERADQPADDEFPIWMDAGCRAALPEAEALFGGEAAVAILGSRLPPMTNWLAVKLLHRRDHGGVGDARVLQVADALFHRLTGTFATHPSAQISLVHQVEGHLATRILAACGIGPRNLPPLAPLADAAVTGAMRARFALPPTWAWPGLQDTNAALLGLAPEDGDGIWLTGTSEVLASCEAGARPTPPARAVRARLGAGWAIYGSAISGGSTVAWFLDEVLRDRDRLAALTEAAGRLPPGADGVLCLPYLGGERMPLWDARWSGAFVGLRGHHGDAHLFRAALEGVALARRMGWDALERALPRRFLLAGGGAANPLWNAIRAAVMDRPLEHDQGADLAALGALRHVLRARRRADHEAALAASLPARRTIAPDPEAAAAYREVGARWTMLHARLAPDGARPGQAVAT